MDVAFFESMGFDYEQAVELAELARLPITISDNETLNEAVESVIDALNTIGCTSFQMSAEELEQLLME